MLLDQLTVRAFRGIRTEVRLDLRARLTIIQAPNGIGKTSLCDAVEWLFTGEVYRLRGSLGRTKGKGIQNIFERGIPPLAEAVVANATDTFRVRREGLSESHRVQVSMGLTRWRSQTLGELLARITPGNLPRSAKGKQAFTNRRNWFRATRFLDITALHLLVDSDQDSNEVRDLVFSDLLGVGGIQSRERNLRKIIAILGSKAKLARDISETEESIRSIEERLVAVTKKASATPLKSFRKHILEISKNLQLKPQSNLTPDEELAIVEEALLSSESEIRTRQQAFAYIRKKWEKVSAAITRISDLEKIQNTTKVKYDETQDLIVRLERAAQDNNEELSKLKIVSDALLALPLEEVKGRLQSALSEWERVKGEGEKPVDISSLASSVAEARARVATAKQLVSLTYQCESSLKIWQQARLIERQALDNLRKLARPKAEERSELESELQNSQVAYDRTETDYQRLTKPLEALRIVGQDFLREASGAQHCPLCGADHGSPQKLRDVITKGLDELPKDLDTLRSKREQLIRAISLAEQQLKEWNATERSAKSFAEEADQARSTLARAEPLLKDAGFSLRALDEDEFERNVAQERNAREHLAASLERGLNQRQKELHAALKLQSIRQEVNSLAEHAGNLQVNTGEYDFERLPPAEWVRAMDHLIRETDNAAARTRGKSAAAEKTVREMRFTLSNAESNKMALAAKADKIAQELSTLRLEQEEFQVQWEALAGNASRDPKCLDEIRTSIRSTVKVLTDSRMKLGAAQEALARAKAIQSKEVEKETAMHALADLQTRLRELKEMLKYRDECEQGANELKLAKDCFVKTQIQPLCDVITALYVRAQSAPFINRIDSTRDNGPLRWMARIGDFKLEDTAQMSLGQRQDLALAIFLARARELGGTFFLDEPLLHLDDLNRVALMDVLRTIVVEERSKPLRLVVTTANQSLVRHCREKFALISGDESNPPFQAYRLAGDSQMGISAIAER